MAQLRLHGRRAAIIVLGLLLGWLVLAVTIDRNFARNAPATALAWNRASADANVRSADMLLQSPHLRGEVPAILSLADRSLRRQPVNPGALRLLAVVKAMQGDTHRAETLARYAEAMSRRDLPTQMWLIEAAVQRGDISNALVHYDRAMKTSTEGRTVLFPVLTAAADDPMIWRPLSKVLARRPQWWRAFVDQLAPKSTSPAALYAIARSTGIDRPATLDPALLQGIEKRLVDLGAYGAAADLFGRAHGLKPGTSPLLRNGGFEKPGGWDPFEWNLQDTPDLAAVRQPGPGAGIGNALFLTAANGQGGDVATQLVILAPGQYRMMATVGGVRGDPLAFPHFLVRCAHDARVLMDIPFPVAPDIGRRWSGVFTVPADCAAQRVVIRAASALDTADAAPWADNLALRPERR